MAGVFWLTCSRDSAHGVLQKEHYDLYLRILKTLYESFDMGKATLIARREWLLAVKPPERGLSQEGLSDAILSMSDSWIAMSEPASYIDFLRKLFFRIAIPRTASNVCHCRVEKEAVFV
uniref:Uncharacterized protein n=1 Tax=Spongospora subterranea TaxID=70186 RepID=A0A0H5QPC4_9EUKA|eukprot:CRZ03903.1 hypothetical protein [Spongospora subterranea]